MSQGANDEQLSKKSKLSRSKKLGKKDSGLERNRNIKPMLGRIDLNETCDFKEPLTFKNTSNAVNKVEFHEDALSSDQDLNETVLCQVCNKDISHMNSVRRTQHVNRCMDKIEEKEKADKKQAKQTKQTIKPPIPDCPMCRRNFKSANARQVHLKKCASISNISTEEMLKLVKAQEQVIENQQDSSANSANLSSKTTKASKPAQSRKRKIKEPKSQFDEDVQLALAVSSSLADQNKTEADMLGDNLIGNTGQNKRRKKKHVMEDVCLLTTLSNEDRQRRVEQKLNSLLVDDVSGSEDEEDLPPLENSSLKMSDPRSKLWQKCNHDSETADILTFYVSALMPPIVANQLKTGSKLKRLSSIPGRETSFLVPHSVNKSVLSCDVVEDVFTASTQTAVVLAELAVDDTVASNSSMLEHTVTGEEGASLHASGFCEETLKLQEATLTHSREQTLTNFRSLVNNAEYSDLSIKTLDGETVHGHKAFLFTRFPALTKLFQASSSSIDLPLSKEATLVFLTYVYTGDLSCTPTIQHELIKMAEKLDLPQLKETCNALTSAEKSNEEREQEESKSDEEAVELVPIAAFQQKPGICSFEQAADTRFSLKSEAILNMKEIWGESDSETEDGQQVRKNGTDTECEMDRQDPICDEDYNDIKCTQRRHLSDEGKYPTVIEEEELGCNEAMDSGKCTQRSTKSTELNHQLETDNDKTVYDEDDNIQCTQRSYVSHTEKYPTIKDVFDNDISLSGESDIIELGNTGDIMLGTDNYNDTNTASATENMETNSPSPKDSRVYGDNSNLPELQTFQNCASGSQIVVKQGSISTSNGNTPETVDKENINTSAVDLFDSPMFTGSCLQPKSAEKSPMSSSSPLFNRKRTVRSQNSACVVQLDLTSIEDRDLIVKPPQNSTHVKNEFEATDVDRGSSWNKRVSRKTSDNHTKTVELHESDGEMGYMDMEEMEYDQDRPNVNNTETRKSDECRYQGCAVSFDERDSLTSKHFELNGSTFISKHCKMDEISLNVSECEVENKESVHENKDKAHDDHASTYVGADNMMKGDGSPMEGNKNRDDDFQSGEMSEEIDLISIASDDGGQPTPRNIDEKDHRNNNEDLQPESPGPIEVHEDIWEDFDDYGMGYTDVPSPVISQKSVSDHNISTDKDVTLTEQKDNIETVCENDDQIDLDLDDQDDSFVFNVSVNKPTGISQTNRFKTPTVKNKEKKQWVPPSPFTPMPDYDSMNTPLLKKEVKKYGVKPVSKKRMVTVLKDIYHKTHQYETDSEFEDEINDETEANNAVSDLDQSPTVKDTNETDSEFEDEVNDETEANNAVTDLDTDCPDVLSQDSFASSQDSDVDDLLEESVMLVAPTSDSDTQLSPQKDVDVKKKMHNFIVTNQDLHMRVLMYEPLEVDVLKSSMKESGIKCSMDKLLEFLDERCIAFTTKNTRKRAQTKRGRKKGSPKKASPKKGSPKKQMK